MKTDVTREADQLANWKSYKNNDDYAGRLFPNMFSFPNRKSFIYDLDHPEKIVLPWLDNNSLASLQMRRYNIHVPDNYEKAVVLLRKGDTILIDGDRFTLGEFLGAGNTTHIYALEGSPDEVIRIPFLSNLRRLKDPNSEDAKKPLRELATRFVNSFYKQAYTMERWALENGFPMVRVKRKGANSRYLIVDRVHGSESGFDFFMKEIVKDDESIPALFMRILPPVGWRSSAAKRKYTILNSYIETASRYHQTWEKIKVQVKAETNPGIALVKEEREIRRLPEADNLDDLKYLRDLLLSDHDAIQISQVRAYAKDVYSMFRQAIWDEEKNLWMMADYE